MVIKVYRDSSNSCFKIEEGDKMANDEKIYGFDLSKFNAKDRKIICLGEDSSYIGEIMVGVNDLVIISK